MRTSTEITSRVTNVSDARENKMVFKVFGMDENGNWAYLTEEHDSFETAKESYDSIELEEGYSKEITVVLINQDDEEISDETTLMIESK